VPTFVIDGEARIGFDADARTGREPRGPVERVERVDGNAGINPGQALDFVPLLMPQSRVCRHGGWPTPSMRAGLPPARPSSARQRRRSMATRRCDDPRAGTQVLDLRQALEPQSPTT
jgi:hypothetical protein